MKVLSLDQSLTHTAWIVWEKGLIYDYGVIKTTKQEGFDEVTRLAYIIGDLHNIMVKENIEYVAIEGLSLSGVSSSTRILSALYYSILLKAYLLGIDYEVFPPTMVKKFATGSGKAKKPDMWNSLPDNIKNKFEKTHKTIASGKYDLTDSYFIGKLFYETRGE